MFRKHLFIFQINEIRQNYPNIICWRLKILSFRVSVEKTLLSGLHGVKGSNLALCNLYIRVRVMEIVIRQNIYGYVALCICLA